MHNSKVPKFLAGSPSETTYAIEVLNPFDAAHAAHLLIILLQLSRMMRHFDVYLQSIAE